MIKKISLLVLGILLLAATIFATDGYFGNTRINFDYTELYNGSNLNTENMTVNNSIFLNGIELKNWSALNYSNTDTNESVRITVLETKVDANNNSLAALITAITDTNESARLTLLETKQTADNTSQSVLINTKIHKDAINDTQFFYGTELNINLTWFDATLDDGYVTKGGSNMTGDLNLTADLRFQNAVTGYGSGDGSVINLGGAGDSLEISNYENSDITFLANTHQILELRDNRSYFTSDIVGTGYIDILDYFELGSITSHGRCITFVSTGDDGEFCWNDGGDYFNFSDSINVSGNATSNGFYDDGILLYNTNGTEVAGWVGNWSADKTVINASIVANELTQIADNTSQSVLINNKLENSTDATLRNLNITGSYIYYSYASCRFINTTAIIDYSPGNCPT